MWSPTHVQVTVQRAKGLLTKGKHKTNDCFVTISLGKEKYQTSVKEKANENVDWHEECELQIPQQGNTAEIVLTALHRNFLGVDEFLGTVSVPLSTFDVYERPKNKWYTLNSKPGKENTKERGELEVKIGFIVKAGSLTDLTRKERHKSSLGQLSTAAQSFGGSLLSIGSLEKRKGLKKLAKSIGNKVKGKSKSKLDQDNLDERDEHHFRPTGQEPGDADPGVLTEDEDEFTFDDLSHKSSASSLNAPTIANPSGNSNNTVNTTNSTNTSQKVQAINEINSSPPIANVAPNKPPRTAINSSYTSSTKEEYQEEDEWGRKLYGKQGSNVLKRWENKPSPRIVIEEPRNERENSPVPSPLPVSRFRDTPEPPNPAPREISTPKNNKDQLGNNKEQVNKTFINKSPKEEKLLSRSPKEERIFKKDKKKEKDQRFKDIIEDGRSPPERIIIGGEDSNRNINNKSRLPHEVLAQFDGKSREDLIELTLHLQSEVANGKKRLHELEDYIDGLLLRVIECSPRLLQNPFQNQRRLSSPGNQ